MNFFAFGDALAQGRMQRIQLDTQRDIEKFNIKVAEQNAALKAQQAGAAEEMQRREGRRLLGTQRAAIAQSGVGFAGSSADIMRQSAASAELDALNIRYAGDLERMGILNEIEMRKFNEKVLKNRGKIAMRARWATALGHRAGRAVRRGQHEQRGGHANDQLHLYAKWHDLSGPHDHRRSRLAQRLRRGAVALYRRVRAKRLEHEGARRLVRRPTSYCRSTM